MSDVGSITAAVSLQIKRETNRMIHTTMDYNSMDSYLAYYGYTAMQKYVKLCSYT
jgi:hypothetical protein